MKKITAILALSTLSLGAQASKFDKIDTKADFRFRMENMKDEFKSESQSRQRIRARVSLKYNVDETTKINLRLATTGGATSTNDTLGDSNGGAGEVFFDQAYVSHKVGELAVNLGRMAFPLFKAGKSQLIFDGDFNPEGVHAGYSMSGVYVNLASFWYDENKATSSDDGLDVTITSAQLGYKGEVSSIKYNLGASNYHYEHAHSKNTFSTSEGLNILETYVQLKYDKFTLWYTGTKNNEAQDYNTASQVGLTYGSSKAKGDWKIGASMRTIELNAINTTLMDGDFAGKTADSSGSIVFGKYMLTDSAYTSFGLFTNMKNADEKADTSRDAEKYSKLQIDYGVKF